MKMLFCYYFCFCFVVKRFSQLFSCVLIFFLIMSRFRETWKQKYLHSFYRSNKSWYVEKEFEGWLKKEGTKHEPGKSVEGNYTILQSTQSAARNGGVQCSMARLVTIALMIHVLVEWFLTVVQSFIQTSFILHHKFPIWSAYDFLRFTFFPVGSMVQQTFEGKTFPNYDWARVARWAVSTACVERRNSL